MKTTAAIYLEAGKPLVVDEIDLPDPGPTQVLVRQFATGVCHTQLHALDQADPRVPLTMGHESTGVVVARGNQVTHVKEGDHVMVTWVARNATAGRQPAIAKLTYNGMPLNLTSPVGTYTWARDIVVDELVVVPLDKDIDVRAAAPVGCAVMTGVGAAIHAAQVRPGDACAVIGVGGVGLCVVAGCAIAGAYPIIAVDLSDEKLDFAKQFGATHGVNAAETDAVAAVQELTGGGVDSAFDAIGTKTSMEQVLLMARGRRHGEREGGQAVVVGVPHGEPPSPLMALIVQGKVYRGAPGGCSIPDKDFPMIIRWFREGRLPLDKLVTRSYKLEQINEACNDLREGRIFGRGLIDF